MADRRLVALLAGLAAGCDAEPSSLLLDNVCSRSSFFDPNTGMDLGPACELSGDAQLVTSLSSDVSGVRFGPGGGSLKVRLAVLAAANDDRWTLDALAAATRPEGSSIFRSLTWGSCGPGCPADPVDVGAPLDESYVWVTVVADQPGSNGAQIPTDASLILRATDVDLVDIRTPGFGPLIGLGE
jgi:hypothetical protein